MLTESQQKAIKNQLYIQTSIARRATEQVDELMNFLYSDGEVYVDVNNLKVGDLIVYAHENNGSDYDKSLVKKHLELGKAYTVSNVNVGGSYTDIQLSGFGGVYFNSVMFSPYLNIIHNSLHKKVN